MSNLKVSTIEASTWNPIIATGGTISNTTIGNVTYQIHQFTSTGNSTFEVIDPGTTGEIEYLIVAGGGGGGGTSSGNSGSGGGGGGGYLTGFLTVTATSYNVVVGSGGAGGIGQVTSTAGSNGGNSQFGNIIAIGGGGGAAIGSGNPGPGSNGASGGGGFNGGVGGGYIRGQGSRGGNGIVASPNWPGGGGGGAGSFGVNSTSTVGGNGGAGITSWITGTAVSRAGGGGGGNYNGGTAGLGNGGGANGTSNNTTPSPATPNTGGGGGGVGGLATGGSNRNGGDGGSGIVIVRYPLTNSTIKVQSPSRIAQYGSPIQMLYYRTDERSQWSAPVGSFVGNRILPLGLTITPRRANSLIVMTWMINGEVHYDTNWIIYLGETSIGIPNYQGYNNSPASSGRWVGYVSGIYDAAADVNSTMENTFIQYSIILNTTNTLTFYPAIKSSSGTAYTFNLNRTNGALGQDSYENGVSTGVIQEIIR